MGSEPGIGWNTVRELGQRHEVWVITRANNQAKIESALASSPMPSVHFVYFDLPKWSRFWKRGSRAVNLYYYLWQLGAYFTARKLMRSVSFDLGHHVTFVTYSYPSFLAFLPLPFVWGPVGGGESAPVQFWRSFGGQGLVHEFVRTLARKRGEWDPFVRLVARRASAAFATTKETAERLVATGFRGTLLTQTVAAINDQDMHELFCLPLRTAAPFRVFSIGRLLHWKGFHLGLAAFARLLRECPESEYWIIGDGPERRRLEKQARRLGVSNQVRFFGTLPRAEVLSKIAECDVMLFPSFHDSGGWASVEAMAAGRPVVCLDLGGPGFQVNGSNGIKVPAHSPEQVVEDLANALALLGRDSDRRLGMARTCRESVETEFNWHQMVTRIDAAYQSLVRNGTIAAPRVRQELTESVGNS
jgi:glycosyltransferase involved in cell wall biosynthesis